MGSQILRRNDREKEENHPTSFDDNVNEAPTPQPTYPSSFNLDVLISEIESDMFSQWGSFPTRRPSPSHPRQSTKVFATSTSTSSDAFTAYSDNAGSPSAVSPTFIGSTTGLPPTVTSNGEDFGNGNASVWNEKNGRRNKVMPAVAGIAAATMIAIIVFIAFFWLRKRKRRQALAQQAHMQEMKARRQPEMLAYGGTSSTYPQYAAPPNHPPPAALATPPPVILGPIVPGPNGAYYTGIDTSDIVSMHDRPVVDRTVVDRTGLGNPFADADSLNEEPPPPYRPRSLAPMSRNTSLRAPPAATSRMHLIGGHDQPLSPFADPRDDDAISDISDVSYQEDYVVARTTV